MTFSRILREFARRLKTINPWHFVWIIFLSAEIMTLLLNVLQSLLRWERISAELIFIGIIDAGVNALIISPLAIYFLRHTARLEEMNRLLEAEISERIDAEKALKKSIEEQKRLEAQLMHAQKMEAVGTLAGGVAHDFNNSLSAIMGYAGLLLMKMPQESPFRWYLEKIMKSSEGAAGLVKNLLAFSRKQVMHTVPVDINMVVNTIGLLVRPLIGEHIDLRILLSDKEMVVMADPGQIEQVIMNLVTNARDAIHEVGTVTIRTEPAEMPDEIIDGCESSGGGRYALIAVSDSGEGMDQHTKERIFEPFFTTKAVGRGTGLGLATAYGIIRQHAGHIVCSSEPGSGTEFSIYLPLVDERPRKSQETAASIIKPGTETILIAEDNDSVRSSAKEALEAAGYKVIEARDGDEAVDAFLRYSATEPIDLLLFDVVMPRKNGREAYEQIREYKPDIKILFMSGYAGDILQKKGVVGQGLPFIEKPFPSNVLIEKVRHSLDAP